MNLAQFAASAGVSVVPCGPGWGGRYGYITKDYPHAMTCGFRSHREAHEHWAIETFGEHAAPALLTLIAKESKA